MKKLFLLLLISFYSFTQTSFILDGTGSTSRNNLTLPGYALGITGTTTGPYGIKGTIGLLPITTSGTNITLTGVSPISVSGSNNNYSISSTAISTLTGSGNAFVTPITGGYNVSVSGSAAGSTPWGSITGSILNQADLQASLAAKRSSFFYNVTSVSSIQTYINNVAANADVNLFLPLGVYSITSTITISGKGNVRIYSEGATIANLITTTSVMFNIINCNSVFIEGLFINLNATLSLVGFNLNTISRNISFNAIEFVGFNASTTGISLASSPNSGEGSTIDPLRAGATFKNLIFHNYYTSSFATFDYNNNTAKGIGIYFADFSEYWKMEMCSFENMASGLYIGNGANGLVTNCSFLACNPRNNGIDYGVVQLSESASGANSGKLQISNCQFNHNWGYNVRSDVTATVRPIMITGCHFISNAISNILIKGATNYNHISGNYFNNNYLHAAYANDPYSGFAPRAVVLQTNTSYNMINNNIFVGTTTNAWIATDATSTNNTIKDNWYDTNTFTGATLGLYSNAGANDYFESNEQFTFLKVNNYTITTGDNKRTFTNGTSTGSITFTLPSNVNTSFEVNFQVSANQPIVVTAPASQTISILNYTSPTAGSITSSTAPGNYLTLVYVETNKWVAKSFQGKWNVNTSTQDLARTDIISPASDANYVTTATSQLIRLPIITANRTLTLPTASVSIGQQLDIININTSTVFGWTFASTVIDANGSTITGIFNTNRYTLESDGTNWYVLSKTNPIFTTTLDFPSTSSGATSDLTIGAVGASLSDAIILGVPNSSVPASGNIGIYSAWVSATDIITVRFSNGNTLNTIDPASGQFKITLLK